VSAPQPAIDGATPANTAPEPPPHARPATAALPQAEWRRVELLALAATQLRDDGTASEGLLDELARVQGEVGDARRKGSWPQLGVPLDDLERDILVGVAVPEAEPRVGWLFRTLQGGAQPYPAPALLQELLALDAAEATPLHAGLAEDGRLRRAGLVRCEGGVYDPVRPGTGVAELLLGRPYRSAPPGSHRVTRRAGWADLVLPEDRVTQLREFVAWVQHRPTVIDRWGGARLGGPIALFTGPSGTGKTLAASVVAAALAWPLFRVDLGVLVSKYIGETEKNLNALFDAAHGRPMVLQFDEADSIFSKRGEIREARDRYANLEVSHLLTRIERHDGPCILTTNLRQHLDGAFTRRFQVVVDFPRPDAAARSRLWGGALPGGAPRAPDVTPPCLGEAVNLTGGEIQNAALHAAYVAAADGRRIELRHLALAVWRELGKDGRELTTGDLGALAEHLPAEVIT
jgi:DNA polymerase III delta prime subunit